MYDLRTLFHFDKDAGLRAIRVSPLKHGDAMSQTSF